MRRSLGIKICWKMEKAMKVTMWQVVVVLNKYTKFLGSFEGKVKKTNFPQNFV